MHSCTVHLLPTRSRLLIVFIRIDGRVSLSVDGIVKLSKSERAKKSKADDEDEEQSSKKKSKDKKKKKRKDESNDDKPESKKRKSKGSNDEISNHIDEGDENNTDNNFNTNERSTHDTTQEEEDPATKNKPCPSNPQGITRLFLGNLPYSITDSTLNDHLNSTITHIKWITDKNTGKFYGSAFCEVRNSRDAAKAVTEINGTKVMGRPIKINYAPMQAGQEKDWPPKQRVITGGKVANAGQAGGEGIKAMSVKPEGCCKLFIGNLSYELDDDGITKFFMAVDAEIKAVRWLYHKDSGDFKGW
jgi:nucleolin